MEASNFPSFKFCHPEYFQAQPCNALVSNNLTMCTCTSTTHSPLLTTPRALIYDFLFYCDCLLFQFSYSAIKSILLLLQNLNPLIFPLNFFSFSFNPILFLTQWVPYGQLKRFSFMTFNSLDPSFSSCTTPANSQSRINCMTISPHLYFLGMQNTM